MTHEHRTRRTLPLIAAIVVSLLVGIVVAQWLPDNLLGLRGHTSQAGHDAQEPTEDDGQLWTCGMHPHVIEDEPGQCPICGMNLTPMKGSGAASASHAGHEHGGFSSTQTNGPQWTCPDHSIIVESGPGTCPIDGLDLIPLDTPSADDAMANDNLSSGGMAGGGTVVKIDPVVVQNMNVRTEIAERRDLTRPIRTVGYLEFDQQQMVTVTTKFAGWIEKVNVNYVGEKVRRGQPLFEIYAPELVQTEQELLSALAFANDMANAPEDARDRAWSMVESARTRLGYWDVAPEQITRLEETGEVFRTLEVSAPAGGVVMMRMTGLEGMAVKPGMELFHIADLSSLWLSAELYEDQLAAVHEGTEAEITLPYFPGETFHGRVRFLEPELSEKTRTMRAQIEVPNRDGRLRKGMYATVDLQPIEVRDVLTVPRQAVLRTGQRNVVVVALGEGRFQPRDVTLGHEAEGFVEILTGLDDGAEIVTSSQFLLDSESSLREAIQKMITDRQSDANALTRSGDDGFAADAAANAHTMTDHSGH